MEAFKSLLTKDAVRYMYAQAPNLTAVGTLRPFEKRLILQILGIKPICADNTNTVAIMCLVVSDGTHMATIYIRADYFYNPDELAGIDVFRLLAIDKWFCVMTGASKSFTITSASLMAERPSNMLGRPVIFELIRDNTHGRRTDPDTTLGSTNTEIPAPRSGRQDVPREIPRVPISGYQRLASQYAPCYNEGEASGFNTNLDKPDDGKARYLAFFLKDDGLKLRLVGFGETARKLQNVVENNQVYRVFNSGHLRVKPVFTNSWTDDCYQQEIHINMADAVRKV